MKTHLTDGQLRAALDGELHAAALAHLDGCETCQLRQRSITEQQQRVAASLSFLIPSQQVSAPNPQNALRLFSLRKVQKELPMMKKLFTSTGFRFAVIAIVLLSITLSFPQTRALADQLLNLFRIQQVTVLPLDMAGIQSSTGQQLGQMLSSSMVVTKKPEKPVDVADAAQASKLTGFNVRLPQNNWASSIRVLGGTAYSFTIDRARAQALLNEAGRTDLQLPETIDGKTISVNIPSGVSANFGNCPKPGQNYDDDDAGNFKCVTFLQIPSPVVDAPAEVNVPQLAQIALEVTGMSHDEAAAYIGSVDWTSTLVIPIPKYAAYYRKMDIEGVTGAFIQRTDTPYRPYMIVWAKNGILYSMSGQGSTSNVASQIIKSLP